MRGAYVPIRTCLGCGQKRHKGELVRIVSTDRGFAIDKGGRSTGRGAYLCPQTGCISALLKKRGRLSYSLRVSLPREVEDGFLRELLKETGEEE